MLWLQSTFHVLRQEANYSNQCWNRGIGSAREPVSGQNPESPTVFNGTKLPKTTVACIDKSSSLVTWLLRVNAVNWHGYELCWLAARHRSICKLTGMYTGPAKRLLESIQMLSGLHEHVRLEPVAKHQWTHILNATCKTEGQRCDISRERRETVERQHQ